MNATDDCLSKDDGATLNNSFDGKQLNAATTVGSGEEDTKMEAKNLMTALSNQHELNLSDHEKELCHSLLHRSGKLYGIGASTIYVWVAPRLVPVGTWIDSSVLATVPIEERSMVQNPKDAYANVDLVGGLWTGKSPSRHRKQQQQNARNRLHGQQQQQSARNRLHWTDLSSVLGDPLQSHSPRTEELYKAGLEKATGIKFDVFGIRGMVVYYAKAGADDKILSDPATEKYICRVAYLKGAMLAVVEARRDAAAILPEPDDLPQSDSNDTGSLGSPTEMAQQVYSNLHWHKLRKNIKAWLRKTAGAGAQIPQCLSWKESLWTAVGTFIGVLLIAILNKMFKELSDEEHFIIVGPFGALTMLQYGLVGSPAGQPRTVLAGHAIAGAIALTLTYIPEEYIVVWMRQALSVTLSNLAMVKLGVACPPASAHSLIYSEGKHDWYFWGITMIGCVVSFVPAIFFNNMNPKRQYPSFWGYAPARIHNHWIQATKHDGKTAEKVTTEAKQVGKATSDEARNLCEITMETSDDAISAVKHEIQIASGGSNR